MRTATSIALALILISFAAVCSPVMCPAATGHSGGCCHHSSQQRVCHVPAVDCPWVVLDNGTKVKVVSQAPALPQAGLPFRPAVSTTLPAAVSWTAATADLFLRIHALLI